MEYYKKKKSKKRRTLAVKQDIVSGMRKRCTLIWRCNRCILRPSSISGFKMSQTVRDVLEDRSMCNICFGCYDFRI